jgi:hypothetical protein
MFRTSYFHYQEYAAVYIMFSMRLYSSTSFSRGLGSSVGIVTGYGLDGPFGARFFAHVQTGPGAHTASCTMGSGSFPEVKRPGRGADQVENEYNYTSPPPLGP